MSAVLYSGAHTAPPAPFSLSTGSKRPPSPSSPKRVLPPLPPAASAAATGPAVPASALKTGASATGASGAGAGSAGCRLLWRGRLTAEDGLPLHGVAIIAHLFSVPSALSPSLALNGPAASLSPFDDPFSSASSATASGADMCLGLEMLRGAPIAVKSHIRVRRAGESPAAVEKTARKGKGRAKCEDELETVEVETPTDVRVYVDQRCPDTVEWLEDAFCREGREGCGVILDAGGEEVILFASLPELAHEPENRDPTASTSSQTAPRPPLTLLLGRRARANVRKPRPDDPMPRENLFANKLRKTASLPASAFALSTSESLPPPAKKPKRQTAKDKAIASLMSKNDQLQPPSRTKRAASSQPSGLAFPAPSLPPPAAPASRSFSRSTSYSRFSSVGPPNGANARQASLPPLASLGASSRRSSLSAAGPSGTTARPFQRTLSRSSMLLDSPPGSDDEVDDASRSRRHASPTPSMASLFDGGEADEGEGEGAEGMDAVAELRTFGARRRGTAAGGGGGLARSSSLPVGSFALGAAAAPTTGVKSEIEGMERREREGTALPGPAPAAKDGTVEVRNKNTVKKLTLVRMTALGCPKAHPNFRDVFSYTTRGVGFAMRETFKTMLLSPSDRELASSLIEQHLRMYLPSSTFPTPSPTPELATVAAVSVKSEPLDAPVLAVPSSIPPAMPSPKSLGDGLEELNHAPPKPVEEEGDVEMDETQVHVEEETQDAPMEDTQVVELADDEDEEDVIVLVSAAAPAESVQAVV